MKHRHKAFLLYTPNHRNHVINSARRQKQVTFTALIGHFRASCFDHLPQSIDIAMALRSNCPESEIGVTLALTRIYLLHESPSIPLDSMGISKNYAVKGCLAPNCKSQRLNLMHPEIRGSIVKSQQAV
jgi:hypothetical protein